MQSRLKSSVCTRNQFALMSSYCALAKKRFLLMHCIQLQLQENYKVCEFMYEIEWSIDHFNVTFDQNENVWMFCLYSINLFTTEVCMYHTSLRRVEKLHHFFFNASCILRSLWGIKLKVTAQVRGADVLWHTLGGLRSLATASWWIGNSSAEVFKRGEA